MVALFVDLKAAFDTVNREILIKTLREKGVREELVVRIAQLGVETRSRVRIGNERGECFWTARGVRQGCPISPLLFNLLTADLEEEMGKIKWGGVKIGKERIYTLSYADDIVLMAENEEEMKSMIERLETYLNKKGLELNVKKTKILRCRKGGGREKKYNWRWKGHKLEEVKDYNYLGYKIKKNGGQDGQVKDRAKKAAMIMGQVWAIGKRRFEIDIRRRLWLFDRLVWSVMGYGVEIWGWKEREEFEKLHERYIRWVLGVDWRTPGYMIREEVQRDKLSGIRGNRAFRFEKRLDEGMGSKWARDCLREIRERRIKGIELSEWEKKELSLWRKED